MKWNDCTSYSQRDTDKKPTAWEIKSGDIRIVITCGHINCPGEWVMHCLALDINCYELNVETKKEAQNKAVLTVRDRLELLLSYVNLIPF